MKTEDLVAESANVDHLRCLSVAQVCSLLGISRITLWQYRRSGKFPAGRRITESRIVWPVSEVEEFLKSCPRG